MTVMATPNSRTTSTAGHATLRCRDCKATGRRAFTMHHTTTAHEGRMLTSQAMELDGRTRNVRDRYAVIHALHMNCPVCGSTRVNVNLVKGTYIADKTCGARCMNAVGPDCECSCAGENHGANHRTWN